MTRNDRTWLWAVAGVAIALALWAGICYAQSGLSVPGDLSVTDDITVGDDLTVGDDSTVSGTSTMNKHSSSYLPQRYVIAFDESSWTNKAYPDTFVGMPMRTLIYAPTDGLIVDIYFAVETAGTGWDSLPLDIRAGDSADSTVLTGLPQMTPAAGDKSNTLLEGRAAVMGSTIAYVDAGEHIRIWGLLYGSSADPPTGLKAWVVFQPDYGN